MKSQPSTTIVSTALRPLQFARRATGSGWRSLFLLGGAGVLAAAGLAGALNLVIARLVRLPDGSETAGIEFAVEAAPAKESEQPSLAAEDEDPEYVASWQQPAEPLDDYMDPILGRSLFDSSSVGQEAGELVVSDGVEPTDLAYELILTSVASEPRYSTALLRKNERDATAEMFAEGDALADATVDEIVRGRVYVVRGNGAREYFEIGAETPKSRRSRGKSQTRKYGRKTWKDGITKVSSTHYRIERGALDTALANLNKLSRGARVVPKKYKGKSGYKIYRIKSSSPYKYLGLRNNDILVGVNGQSVSDPAQAMELYNQLKDESNVTLDVIRRGKEMTIEYDIY